MADAISLDSSATIRLKRSKCNQTFLSSHRTVISKDKRLAICGCGNRLHVYSVKTGKHLRALEGHEAFVVDYHFRIKNTLQLISADKSGVIILWDITDGAPIKKMKVPYYLSGLLVHPINDEIIYVIKKSVKEKKNGKAKPSHTLQKIDLSRTMKGKSEEDKVVTERICAVGECSKSVTFSQNGSFAAYINGLKLHIISLKDQFKRSFGFEGKPFTSIAFHPSKITIATGSASGKIILWSNFLSGQTPTAIQLHWHVHPVDAVSFTNDGLYLLSGGLENVLVIWQLASHNKDFLPRMGGHIKFISVSNDDNFVLVTLSNNAVKILSLVDRHLKSTLQGLSKVSYRGTTMRVDPRSGCLVVPVLPDGRLQFYNPENDSVLTTFDVVGQNYIIGPKRDASIMSKIKHFDFNDDGSWLATIEHGMYKHIPDDVKLKFWSYGVNAQKYQMVTIAETPHDDDITCLRLRPRPESSAWDEMAITTDSGGRIKFWVFEENADSNDSPSWKCLSACKYGSSSCTKADFSRDGSLFAVIYGKEITIWDSETRNLRTSFYCPMEDKFRDVVFGAGSSDPYLLTRTSRYILCWNLLSCTMCWSIQAQVTAMTVDPFSGYFAVFAVHMGDRSNLCLLDAATSKVVRMGKSGPSFKVESMVFSSTETVNCEVDDKVQKIGRLYALNSEKNIYKYGPKMEVPIEENEFESLEEEINTEFANIFGSRGKNTGVGEANLDIEESFRKVPGKHSAAVITKIIGTPSHVLPSVTSLSATFFKAVTMTHSPEWHESASDIESEDLPAVDDKASDSDAELSNKERNEVIAQKDVSISEEESRSKIPDRNGRPRAVNFAWISDFLYSNYDS